MPTEEENRDQQKKRQESPGALAAKNQRRRERRANPQIRERDNQRRRDLSKDPRVRDAINQKQRDRKKKLRESSEARAAENEAQRNRRLERNSQAPLIVAAEIYQDYRQLHGGWPEVPPEGMRFAVHPESAGLKTLKGPQVVSLEVPSSGPSASSVPSFLADPSLDLDNHRVRNSILQQGVEESEYETAKECHTKFLDRARLEEFATDAALSSSDHAAFDYQVQGPGQFDYPAQDYGYQAPEQEPAEMFGDQNIDDLDISQLVSSDYDGPELDSWPSVVNPVAPYADEYGQFDTSALAGNSSMAAFSQYEPVALSQSFENMHLPSYDIPQVPTYPVGHSEGPGNWTAAAFLPPSAAEYAQPQPYSAPAAHTWTEQTQGKGKAPQR